ncbi:MAG: hypothetical protein DCC65_05350 [Planctomycetota bacterium]|nr:MAG: hypothetical protein DCC65_05350 [Planctomycetota bacterium]
MSPRCFIPLSILAFCVLVGGPWAYLSLTDERSRLPPREPSVDLLDRLDSVAQEMSPGSVAHPPTDGARGPQSSPGDSIMSWRHDSQAAASPPIREKPAPGILDRLDETSVRLRSQADRSAAVQYGRAIAAAHAGRLEEAVEHLDRALTADPRNADLLRESAAVHVALSRFADADTIYEELLKVNPGDAAARYNRAVVLFRLARFFEAAQELRETVRLEPDHAEAWYNLASLAQREGRLSEAREALEAFTRLRPEAAGGWFQFGVVHMDLDAPHAASACFLAAVEADPRDAAALLNLGISYAHTGEYELALAAVEKANTLTPCDETILRHLAALHDLLADRDGPRSDEHRRLATAFAEQVDAIDAQP